MRLLENTGKRQLRSRHSEVERTLRQLVLPSDVRVDVVRRRADLHDLVVVLVRALTLIPRSVLDCGVLTHLVVRAALQAILEQLAAHDKRGEHARADDSGRHSVAREVRELVLSLVCEKGFVDGDTLHRESL